ncbi:MAG: PAS domain S-box protein [Bryobacterales bacterium]|nr:PAS domain S-box protein [Bryobacterales bacterium]
MFTMYPESENRILEFFSGCVLAMQTMSTAPFSESLVLALKQLAEVALIDRVSVFELPPPAAGAPPIPTLVAEFRRERRSSAYSPSFLSGTEWNAQWYADLQQDRVVEGSNGEAVNPDASKPPTQSVRRRSVVAVPIEVEGILWGFLRMDFIHGGIVWTSQHEGVARSFAGLLGALRSLQTRSLPLEEASALTLNQLAGEREIAFELDAKGNWSFLSPAWDRLTGYRAQRALGSHHSQYFQSYREGVEGELVRLDFLDGMGASGTHAGEAVLKAEDGSHLWVSFLVTRLPAKDGFPLRYQGVLADIRNRKTLEAQEKASARELQSKNAELLAALMAAQKATRLQGNFLATMSHEIRTPLNGVLGMTSLLLQTSLDRRQREFGQAIQSSAESLLSIVNSILDYSKLEAQRVDLEEVYYNPRDLVEDVCAGLAEPASRKRIDLVVHTLFPIPDMVLGDPGKVRLVLMNLIGNAIKFSKKGEVGIVVSWEPLVEDTGELRLEVIDFGIGMSEETMERLFHPFSQAGPATSRIYGGTGLGLAISKQFCELMGGEIRVESKLGAGSRFRVLLRTSGTSMVEGGWQTPAETEAFRGKRVLLAGAGDLAAQSWFTALLECGLHMQRSQGLRDTLEFLSKETANRLTDVAVFDTKGLEGGASEINRGIRLVTQNPQLLLVLLDSIHSPVDRSVLNGVEPLLVLRKPISPYRALAKIAAAQAALPQTPRKPIQRLTNVVRETQAVEAPALVFAASEARRKGLGYLMRQFSMSFVSADNFQDLIQHAAHGEFNFILLDADLGVHTELEVAQKLRSALGASMPPLVGTVDGSASRAFLVNAKLFDVVLDEGFQREDLSRVVSQFSSLRSSTLRASVS